MKKPKILCLSRAPLDYFGGIPAYCVNLYKNGSSEKILKSSKLSSNNKTIFEFFLFKLTKSKIILSGIYRTKMMVLNLYKFFLFVDLRLITLNFFTIELLIIPAPPTINSPTLNLSFKLNSFKGNISIENALPISLGLGPVI